MKLVISVIQQQDEPTLTQTLNRKHIGVTRISSRGGFLREGNATLFMVVPDEQVDEVMRSLREHCHTRTKWVAPLPPVAEAGEFYPSSPMEVQVGGATVFVLDATVLGRV